MLLPIIYLYLTDALACRIINKLVITFPILALVPYFERIMYLKPLADFSFLLIWCTLLDKAVASYTPYLRFICNTQVPEYLKLLAACLDLQIHGLVSPFVIFEIFESYKQALESQSSSSNHKYYVLGVLLESTLYHIIMFTSFYLWLLRLQWFQLSRSHRNRNRHFHRRNYRSFHLRRSLYI